MTKKDKKVEETPIEKDGIVEMETPAGLFYGIRKKGKIVEMMLPAELEEYKKREKK